MADFLLKLYVTGQTAVRWKATCWRTIGSCCGWIGTGSTSRGIFGRQRVSAR